ncbi:S9 family peptidase [Rhodopirellula sallentina]|uniref:Peptidase S9, prolyl oligopeptidase active site domain protein n=1 Tax=Rhodopirellula sallentina SM41 TaxID=1263870 RepID=M5UH25_9BACT|nr:prolyl oligopeptidase family serine peptidase [Rhodopirellula sallentina]EMI55323.1 peptidase S9, prolyl oligopeptidase active site domain protein [Rhodopirellula sallentina SM41]
MKLVLASSLLIFLVPDLILAQESETTVFKDRSIDLAKHLDQWPYRSYAIYGSYAANQIGLIRESATSTFVVADLQPNSVISFDKAEELNATDLANVAAWKFTYNAVTSQWYFKGDEERNEEYNLYVFNKDAATKTKLTNVPYLYDYAFSKDYKRVAYTARVVHSKEGSPGEVRILDLETGEDMAVYKDEDEAFKLTWGSISWHPEEEGVIFVTAKDGDRTKHNLVYVDLTRITPASTVVTDPEIKRTDLALPKKWLSTTQVGYGVTENDTPYIRVYDFASNETKLSQQTSADVADLKVASLGGRAKLIVLLNGIRRQELRVVDPEAGTLERSIELEGGIELLDTKPERVMVAQQYLTDPLKICDLNLAPQEIEVVDLAGISKELASDIVHCTVKEHVYKTFDDITYDIDGETFEGEIFGYLYSPKNPLPREQAIVLIEGFYGAYTDFDVTKQVLCEAGIYVFSPNPRGNRGSGAFANAQIGDYGGSDTLDGIYAAKYASELLGIPPERVGVFGMSYGGYLTLRHLTFQGEVNGHQASFPWGFGISEAGISQVLRQADPQIGGSVAGYVERATGPLDDPATWKKFQGERSPANLMENFNAKLLLIHGTADTRVTPIESRDFYWRAREQGKGDLVTYIEYEGQGHYATGRADKIKRLKDWLEFLAGI